MRLKLLVTLAVLSLPFALSPDARAKQQDAPAAAAPAGPALNQAHTLLDGTPVKVRLTQTISSADSKVGQEVPFEVLEEVKVDDVVVLPKGANVIATVTEAEHKRTMGRAGKLNVSVSYGRLADDEKVALRAVKETKGGGHVGAMTGAIVATSIVFFPAAPLFLFIHGKDIVIPQGTEVTAFVDGDMHLDMSRFGAQPDAAPAAAAAAQFSVIIDSTPPNADIEIDGSFVGNTPSSVNVTPGKHEIAVHKKGFAAWMRTLNVSGGNVHLNADLEASAPGAAPAPPAEPAAPAPAPQ